MRWYLWNATVRVVMPMRIPFSAGPDEGSRGSGAGRLDGV
jgi:hypothetical protein